MSHAFARTDNASKYLVQLAKHWSHKVPTLTYYATRADVALPGGHCVLKTADGALELMLATETDADATLLEQVVANHLRRFALCEQLEFEWARHKS